MLPATTWMIDGLSAEPLNGKSPAHAMKHLAQPLNLRPIAAGLKDADTFATGQKNRRRGRFLGYDFGFGGCLRGFGFRLGGDVGLRSVGAFGLWHGFRCGRCFGFRLCFRLLDVGL